MHVVDLVKVIGEVEVDVEVEVVEVEVDEVVEVEDWGMVEVV